MSGRSAGAAALGVLLAAVLLAAAPAAARQFREINPVPTPDGAGAALPEGAVAVERPRPMTREEIEPLVRKVMAAWNTSELDSHLAEGFHDRSRLSDAVDTVAPRDAKLRVLSIQGVQTLGQFVQPDPDGGGERLVTRVSVTVRTQLEFNSPAGGFQRREGLNEYVLRITRTVPR